MYSKDDIELLCNRVLNEYVDDIANNNDHSFEDYDYGFLAGIRDFKKSIQHVLDLLETDEAL